MASSARGHQSTGKRRHIEFRFPCRWKDQFCRSSVACCHVNRYLWLWLLSVHAAETPSICLSIYGLTRLRMGRLIHLRRVAASFHATVIFLTIEPRHGYTPATRWFIADSRSLKTPLLRETLLKRSAYFHADASGRLFLLATNHRFVRSTIETVTQVAVIALYVFVLLDLLLLESLIISFIDRM